jgi:para-nitrobenzyl esterase
MKNRIILAIAVISLLNFGTAVAQTVIATQNGKIEGYQEQNLLIFKGIPFAAPPIGSLRWKAPQPASNWTGTRKCTEFSASPVQNKPMPFYCWSEEFIAKPEPLNEDCLYLNVWASAKAKKLPVFVWIYGGGLSSGSANCDIYDGEKMAQKGVIFVSINYRVGVLGFMAHPELSKESGYNASGNYGFLDQIAALQWVQKNIAAFGGDPSNVTIAGQSAGAFSVNALIASPLAKGLFHKAIPQSGGLLSNMLSQNLGDSEKQGTKFMEMAKCSSIDDLRKKSAQELQNLSNNSQAGRFGVTMDGYVLPLNIMEHFKNGKHNQVPILTGWVTGDGSFLGESKTTVEEYQKEAKNRYGDKAEEFLEIFPAKTNDEVKAMKQRQTLMGFAGMPSHLLAVYTNKPAYIYQFGHVPPDKPNFPNYGAFHTSEVPYALHTLHTWKRPWQQTDLDLEETISSYWVNFAKTGNPNGKGLPEWKIYEKQNGNIMVFGDKASIQKGLVKKEFDFLEANSGK